LEFKGARSFKSNISGSSINLKVRRRRRHETTICGRTSSNTKGHKGKRSTQSENTTTERSVTKQNGN